MAEDNQENPNQMELKMISEVLYKNYLLSEQMEKSSDFRYLGIKTAGEFVHLVNDRDKDAERIFHTTLDAICSAAA